MKPKRVYNGVSLSPYNLPSYLSSSQLGLPSSVPRPLIDHALLSTLVCTVDDDYPAIAPNLAVQNINPEPPTYCLRFCPVEGFTNLLGIANEDGRVAIQDTSKVLPKIPLTGFSCHDNAIFDICWSYESAKTLVTVSGDQNVRLWDIGAGERGTRLREFTGHSRSVKCVEWQLDSSTQFATAGRDNCIMIWDTRDKNDRVPDNAIKGVHSTSQTTKKRKCNSLASPSNSSPQGVVTALTWIDSNTLASTGDTDGVIKLWDLRKNYSLYKREPLPKLEITHPGSSSKMGYTSLSPSPCRNYLYASCMDDIIYKYDIVNGFSKPCSKYTGASISNFFIKMDLSPCGRYLVSGSSDNWAYVWNTTSEGAPVARLGEQVAEVTCVAWSQEKRSDLPILVTASDDMKHQLWKTNWKVLEEENIKYKIEMLNKVEPKRVYSPFKPAPMTPSTRTPKRIIATPKLVKKGQTPSIKTFLTPKAQLTPLMESPVSNITPTNEGKRGCKRRQTLDFNDENSPDESSKISKNDSCRNLSSSIASLYTSPAKCEFTANTYKSPRKLITCSPLKSMNSPKSLGSPLKLFSPLREMQNPMHYTRSPTANLPNLVLDGTSPRSLTRIDKKKNIKKGSDWLTNYTIGRKEVGQQSRLNEALKGLTNKTGGFSKVKSSKKKNLVRKIKM